MVSERVHLVQEKGYEINCESSRIDNKKEGPEERSGEIQECKLGGFRFECKRRRIYVI